MQPINMQAYIDEVERLKQEINSTRNRLKAEAKKTVEEIDASIPAKKKQLDGLVATIADEEKNLHETRLKFREDVNKEIKVVLSEAKKERILLADKNREAESLVTTLKKQGEEQLKKFTDKKDKMVKESQKYLALQQEHKSLIKDAEEEKAAITLERKELHRQEELLEEAKVKFDKSKDNKTKVLVEKEEQLNDDRLALDESYKKHEVDLKRLNEIDNEKYKLTIFKRKLEVNKSDFAEVQTRVLAQEQRQNSITIKLGEKEKELNKRESNIKVLEQDILDRGGKQ